MIQPSVRRLLQSACIFLLLFAQQAALTHVLWHALRSAPVQSIERSASEVKRQSGTPHIAALCSLHALLGQVLGAASGNPRGHADSYATRETPQHHARELVHQDFLAPLSRGPPSHLVS